MIIGGSNPEATARVPEANREGVITWPGDAGETFVTVLLHGVRVEHHAA